MRRIDELVREGGQFVVSTHSPLLIAHPGARIYELDGSGIHERDYRETGTYLLHEAFLRAPEAFLRRLFEE